MHSPPATRERRWSQHGWNNPRSLSLIRGITPRLPGPILELVHWVTTALCFAAMGRERRASLANLRRVCGGSARGLWVRSFMQFFNFSRFMVSRFALAGCPAGQLAGRVVNLEEARRALESVLHDGAGAVVATAHLGHWEMGVRLLQLAGRPVHVVMMADGEGAIEREYEQLRAVEGVRVHWRGGNPFLSAELLAALRRGEVVALQADREAGPDRVRVPLFGAPAWLPLGPARLARAAQVPILPCFVLMEEDARVRVRVETPIRVGQGPEAARDLEEATHRLARAIEAAVAERPEQWFNFYPVWDPRASPA